MMIAGRRVDISLLKSKVARRVFLLFILCALLPQGALALFSFVQVRAHLGALSARRLQQACKSAGMTVIERLWFLESDLQRIIADLPRSNIDSLDSLQVDLRTRVADRFEAFVVVADDGRVLSSLRGTADVLPALDPGERAHLRAGKTLVSTARRADSQYAVFLARLVDPARPARGSLFGEVNADYLWGGDGFLTPPAELCVFGPDSEPLFSTFPNGAPRAVSEASTGKNGPSGQFEWSQGGDQYVARYWTLFMRPDFFNSWVVVQSEPMAVVMEPLRNFGTTFFLVVLLTFWVAAFMSLRQIRRSMVPVELLKDATQEIKNRNLSHRVKIDTNDEFAELGASFNEMTESMENHVRVVSTMNRVGISLSAEKDEARLLEVILLGAQAVFRADGGALFLMSPNERLMLSIIQIDSLRLSLDGSTPEALADLAGTGALNVGTMWATSGATERTMVTADVYGERGPTFAPQIELDRRLGYRTRSLLSIPLKNHDNEVIGILQLMNAQAGAGREGAAFSAEDQRLAESLASQAAVALTKNRLVDDFKGLFEGLTELISQAIDEKSPYTGGHVRRVVDLAMMIARSAASSPNSALREFAASEDALYELRIAALLHDCGKITTPVHVQDKATKLQTIWDRMNLVDTRGEIIRRDRKVTLLEAAVHTLTNGNGDQVVSDIERTATAFDRQLEEDLRFLHTCNMGTEDMPEMLRERVRAIARKYTWVNARHGEESLVSPDELHHLTIPSGTLSQEEREIINNHVESTVRMLEKLPYPKKLRNIPRAAGTHHERMDGTGYPRKLTREDIPLAGRIIGIADIFEALTARDRPYRKAKNLAEALDALREMADTGHIDPELYDLFITEKIYLRYAAEHLDAERQAEPNERDQLRRAARP